MTFVAAFQIPMKLPDTETVDICVGRDPIVGGLDIQREFGLTLRALRKQAGLSQGEVAERAGLHRTYVCDIERGVRNVSLISMQRLSFALGVSICDLFGFAQKRHILPLQTGLPETRITT